MKLSGVHAFQGLFVLPGRAHAPWRCWPAVWPGALETNHVSLCSSMLMQHLLRHLQHAEVWRWGPKSLCTTFQAGLRWVFVSTCLTKLLDPLWPSPGVVRPHKHVPIAIASIAVPRQTANHCWNAYDCKHPVFFFCLPLDRMDYFRNKFQFLRLGKSCPPNDQPSHHLFWLKEHGE